MSFDVRFAQESVRYELAADRLQALGRCGELPPLNSDLTTAVRQALNHPIRTEALRRALTPGDQVTLVLDERLPRLSLMLAEVLEHITSAGVEPACITILSSPPVGNQGWVDDLPDDFQDVHVEVHDPSDSKRLGYLATTKAGRRVYLNRSLIDADQVVILAGTRYDTAHGFTGGAYTIFPALSDAATRQGLATKANKTRLPSAADEAVEVGWLLGMPFLVQVIEAGGDEVPWILGGWLDSWADGRRLFDARWSYRITKRVDTVIASLTGPLGRWDFADMAAALSAAAQAVRADGRIVLLTRETPPLCPAMQAVQVCVERDETEGLLEHLGPADKSTATAWLNVTQHAHVFLLSGWDEDFTETLRATAFERPEQAQRILDAAESCLVMTDPQFYHLER